jgi:hypothetical protein
MNLEDRPLHALVSRLIGSEKIYGLHGQDVFLIRNDAEKTEIKSRIRVFDWLGPRFIALQLENGAVVNITITPDGEEVVEYWKESIAENGEIRVGSARHVLRCRDGKVPK